MPRPLLDRMEIIPLEGYTEEEKAEIAMQHLYDKQKKAHGLTSKEFDLSKAGLLEIIRRYTKEAGVRNLEREIAKLCRKALTRIVKSESEFIAIDEKNLEEFLGVKKV